MSGRGNTTDLERVVALVREHPGLDLARLCWIAVGGEVAPDGNPVDQAGFARFVKARSINKRLTEAVKLMLVRRGPARASLQTENEGYYPVGIPGRPTQRAAVAQRPRIDKGRGAAVLAALKRALGE